VHNNYYFLRQLTPRLQNSFTGSTFHSCYSQSKNELNMQFVKADESFNIKAHLQPDFSCLFFPGELSRARRNSVDLFQEAIGLKVTAVEQFKNERSFIIKLDQDKGLLFKMHGNRANILLIENNAPIALFNNKLVKDWQLKPSELHRDLKTDKETFLASGGNYKKIYPTLGKLPEQYLQEKGYQQLDPEQKWNLLQQTIHLLEDPPQYYIIEQEGKPALSLLPFGHELSALQDPLEAINRFFITYTKEYTLEIEKGIVLQQLSKSIKSSHNYLRKTTDKLHELQHSAKNREIADIIMANLHTIPAKSTEVELFDFYHDRPIKIKLKKDLSPQKNAENYYRKAKNQQLEEEHLQQNIRQKEEKILEMELHQENISGLENLKELREYLKQNAFVQTLADQQETLPYRSYEYGGFAIWVGKGASQNDALLRYHAHKDDLWLHAKDVSGSHVILKRKAGQNFPADVKEKAASLAAWYSKRKSDSLCPVICTPRKWVRKPKGAAAGAVKIEKEEQVLLVQPAPFS
jgi:predicted ribosome quality control (RQC) complex YloA/Tae2 family protein